jgi:hypothetical protein
MTLGGREASGIGERGRGVQLRTGRLGLVLLAALAQAASADAAPPPARCSATALGATASG